MVGGGAASEAKTECALVKDWDGGVDAVKAGIEAFFADTFAAATADDVPAALAAVELVLLQIIDVHSQLAATGNFDRSDIAEFHTGAYHELLHDALNAVVSARPDAAAWPQSEALPFVMWCSEYHTRLREVTSLDLADKLTDFDLVGALTSRFIPGLEAHAQKRSPKSGGKLQIWQKRWFVLQHCRLHYYRSRNDDDPLGSILLTEVSSMVRKDDSNDLKLIVAGRKTLIRFETDSDVTAWMDALERCRQLAAEVETTRHGNKKIVSKTAVQYDSAAPGQLEAEIDQRLEQLDESAGDVVATLAAAESITDELTELLDDVATCQPRRDDIAQFYVEQYAQRLYSVICSFLTASALHEMEARHILMVVAWVYNYHERLQKLGGRVPDKLRLTAVPTFQQVLGHVPALSGVLKKMSPRAKRRRGVLSWQRRWFVLQHCILYYYKSEPRGDEMPQGEIRMDQLKSLTLSESRGGLGMKLTLPGRVYYLMAESEDDLRAWVDAIERSTLRGIVQGVDDAGESSEEDDGAGDEAQPAKRRRTPCSPDDVEARLAAILQPRHGYSEEVEQDLNKATEVVLQLSNVLDQFMFDQVEDAVVDELASRCHQCLLGRVEAYVKAIPESEYEQGTTHSILNWLSTYHQELEQQAGSLVPLLYELDCLQPLCEDYKAKILDTMTVWCERLLEQERESVDQIEHSDDDGLFTPGPLDLFTMINQQVATANSTGVDQLTINVLLACESLFSRFAKEISRQVKKDWRGMPLEYLCAVVNNCSRMMELCAGLSEQAELLLSERLTSQLSPEAAPTTFLEVAKTALGAVADLMVVDLAPLFQNAFSDAWFAEESGMAVVVATVADFFGDLQFWLQDHFFKKLVTLALDQVVYMYIEALLTRSVKLTKKVTQGISTDVASIAELADAESGFVREATLRKRTQVIDDVRELLTVQEPNLAKKFVTRYAALLETHPDASVAVEHILGLRTDLKKKHRQGVAQQCAKCNKKASGAAPSDGLFARMQF